MRATGFAGLILLVATTAHAASFDGSTVLNCTIQTVMTCSGPEVCIRGTAQTALLPSVLVVDVPGGVVRGDASGKTVKIVAVGHGAGRMMLHGEEVQTAGTAWNVVVDEASGAMTGAVLTRVGGYIAFGTCSQR